MQINLNSQDLTQAVENYIKKTFSFAEGAHIEIEFTAGRGDKGPRAAVEITPPGQTPPSKLKQADAEEVTEDAGEPEAAATSGPLFNQ